MSNLQHIKQIIAIASGKGGVGKSTVAVNLALALSSQGAQVGLLDADIYGPSVAQAMGFTGGPMTQKQKATGTSQSQAPQSVTAVVAHGVRYMSMGCLVATTTPMVWRGPMVTNALQHMLMNTLWGELDYLLIDMPPGTGDIALTLSQRVPLTGAVVVTTPQDLALLDAQKGIEMFAKVAVPTLGLVENMAYHVCRECGHQTPVFGEGGGQRLAERYQAPLLGQVPLEARMVADMDQGVPTLIADPNAEVSRLYHAIAKNLLVSLASRAEADSFELPEIRVLND